MPVGKGNKNGANLDQSKALHFSSVLTSRWDQENSRDEDEALYASVQATAQKLYTEQDAWQNSVVIEEDQALRESKGSSFVQADIV